jgi:hypothetical protein
MHSTKIKYDSHKHQTPMMATETVVEMSDSNSALTQLIAQELYICNSF